MWVVGLIAFCLVDLSCVFCELRVIEVRLEGCRCILSTFWPILRNVWSQPSSIFGGFGSTPVGQTPSTFSFPSSFQTPQQGTGQNPLNLSQILVFCVKCMLLALGKFVWHPLLFSVVESFLWTSKTSREAIYVGQKLSVLRVLWVFTWIWWPSERVLAKVLHNL